MKTIIILLAGAFILFSASSCKQCSTCRKYPAKDMQLCKKDFATNDSYTDAFHYWEAQGYDCE
jgi:hypothetical protein